MSLAPELTILYDALRAEHGLCVSIADSFQKAQQRFYQARAQSADPSLDILSIRPSPYGPSEIWIVKGKSREKA